VASVPVLELGINGWKAVPPFGNFLSLHVSSWLSVICCFGDWFYEIVISCAKCTKIIGFWGLALDTIEKA